MEYLCVCVDLSIFIGLRSNEYYWFAANIYAMSILYEIGVFGLEFVFLEIVE